VERLEFKLIERSAVSFQRSAHGFKIQAEG